MLVRPSSSLVAFVALVSAWLHGCPTTPATAMGETPPAAPAIAPAAPAPSADAPIVASPPPTPPPPPTDATPPPAVGPIVAGTGASVGLSAIGYPRIDRARQVVTVADTGDDRYAFQASLSLLELTPGKATTRLALEVFSRARFDATAGNAPALDRELADSARVANTKLGTVPPGAAMTACTVAKRQTDDASSCAAGQTVRCGDLTATFHPKAGVLRHPGGTSAHPLWAKSTLRSSEHRASFVVLACLREVAWDAETKTFAARVDRQCLASGGDWCSREPVWTAVTLR